ncbi:PH domain-containing protein [Geodermatophilus sp. YIM 151500]|uniref:PH domain-containing protein n=1 Tax=Geodermatophilus sp. YIM 151500 TaxID=2984531 RepID=UPI0021E4B508|nr:PH domain-containing protein [Geodermatophilus sp. YIM 151500]MCV2488547.1 PH domain-containing protein [Geodermatophilus sp. YIM 151500]
MPYPDRLLGDDEEVVAHLHPHALTLFWPLVLFLLLVGAASFGAALVPSGAQQGSWRLVVVASALLLALVLVVVPLLRWRTTHYVLTTHRLLLRTGVLARHGRDIALSRITEVTYRQTLWDRLIRSGTVTVETLGEHAPTVLTSVPDSEGVQTLLNQLVELDEHRRAYDTAGPRPGAAWTTGSAGWGAWEEPGTGPLGGWGAGHGPDVHRTTGPVRY